MATNILLSFVLALLAIGITRLFFFAGAVKVNQAEHRELHTRIDSVEARIDSVEARIDSVDSRIDSVEKTLASIDSTLKQHMSIMLKGFDLLPPDNTESAKSDPRSSSHG